MNHHIDPRFAAAHFQEGRDLLVPVDSHAPPADADIEALARKHGVRLDDDNGSTHAFSEVR